MQTRTRFLFLMHPKEYKQEKAGTGRLTQLCLTNSSLHMAAEVTDKDAVGELLSDSRFYPVLLYPGSDALNLSERGTPTCSAWAALAGSSSSSSWTRPGAAPARCFALAPSLEEAAARHVHARLSPAAM
jgi:hypothetical protein